MLAKMSNFAQRMAISWLAVALFLTLIYFAFIPLFRPVVLLAVAAVACYALIEYYAIAKAKGYEPLRIGGCAATAAYLVSLASPIPAMPQMVMLATLFFSFLYFFAAGKEPFVNLAVTFFGLLYLTLPLSTLLMILYYFPENGPQDGRLWLLYLLLVAKLTDTGAYGFGKLFGKHKLSPYISPKKTWEGAAGGLAVGVGASLLFTLLVPHFALTAWGGLFMGALLSLLAQLGDLAESLLKRDGKIKDSSKLPGLGGVLDIVDSLIFTAPFIYIYLRLA